MARLRGINQQFLEQLLHAFEELLVAALKSVAKAAARLLGGVPGRVNPAAVSLDDLGVIRVQWLTAVDSELLPALGKTYGRASAATVAQLAQAGADVADLATPDASLFMEQARNRLVRVGDTLWEATRSQLAEGMRAGDDLKALTARVVSAAGVAEARARVIARTEVLAASNAASVAQVRALGDPTAVKEWLATPDERTRDAHRHADGQRVRIGQRFQVGGWFLDFPGDPTGPPEQVVSCRCSLAFDLADEPLTAAPDPYVRDAQGQFAKHTGWAGITVTDPSLELAPGSNARYEVSAHDLETPLRTLKVPDTTAATYQRLNIEFARRYGTSFDTVEHVSHLTKVRGFEGRSTAGMYAYVRSADASRSQTLGLRPTITAGQLAAEEKRKHFAKGTGRHEGLLTHEFGHAYLQGSGTFYPRDVMGRVRAKQAAYDAAVAAGMPADPKLAVQRGVAPVSGYANKNHVEAEAELFALYHWGGPDRPKWAVVWGETLHHELGLDPTPLSESLAEQP